MDYWYAVEPDIEAAIARFTSEEYRDKWVAGKDTFNPGYGNMCASREALMEEEAKAIFGDSLYTDELWEPDMYDDEIEWLLYDVAKYGRDAVPMKAAVEEAKNNSYQVVA